MLKTRSFHHFELRSFFQPIYSLAHRRCVGMEALVRCHDATTKTQYSPIELFDKSREWGEQTELDRLCQELHLNNFQALELEEQWLFLNVCPPTGVLVEDPEAFWQEMQSLRIPPNRLVMEIIEHESNSPEYLAEQVASYRQRGALIAIDDFGAGHSNFDRIWQLEPHIVKLDRSMLLQGRAQRKFRHVLSKLIQLIHGSGALAVMEGIETQDDLHLAFDSGADMVQGFGLAYPAADPRLGVVDGRRKLSAQLAISSRRFEQGDQQRTRKLAPYVDVFALWVGACRRGYLGKEHSNALQQLNGIIRCYLLDQEGYQMGANLTFRQTTEEAQRFQPMQDGRGARWARRTYFREAMARPDSMYISDPYLSISDGAMCLTISQAFTADDGQPLVLCFDIDASDWEESVDSNFSGE
ncbi:EAL domain-containing protein [Pokkaliibacter sp. CJK22405]|uniref:EAL domain-containing protein n=1 Tax=Pokkaliibacter sp. CJK22405 TaxID=3384615 RepID=UPI0039846769